LKEQKERNVHGKLLNQRNVTLLNKKFVQHGKMYVKEKQNSQKDHVKEKISKLKLLETLQLKLHAKNNVH